MNESLPIDVANVSSFTRPNESHRDDGAFLSVIFEEAPSFKVTAVYEPSGPMPTACHDLALRDYPFRKPKRIDIRSESLLLNCRWRFPQGDTSDPECLLKLGDKPSSSTSGNGLPRLYRHDSRPAIKTASSGKSTIEPGP